MIDPRQPLRAVIPGRKHVRCSGELYISSVETRLSIDAQHHGEWRSSAAKIAESAEVQIEPRVIREKRLQAGHCVRRGDLYHVIAGGMMIFLLEAGKEEGLVLANWTAGGEAENIVAEDRLRDAIQPVQIRNRIKSLRLVVPEQRAVEIVGPRLCD